MERKKIYLSLGGNEGQVLLRLQKALHLLSLQKEVEQLQISRFYSTAPLQVNSSLWFVNAVCSFHTVLTPPEIFKMTQAIERNLGKVPKPKTANRPIDIDFLFYDHQTYREKDLEIPHPRWKERLFVLMPLTDLTPEIVLQGIAGVERFVLQDLIQPLLTQSQQIVYLLEKNPDFQ